MAKNGFQLIDAEMHVMEPVDLWERYIDAEFSPARAATESAQIAPALSVNDQQVARPQQPTGDRRAPDACE